MQIGDLIHSYREMGHLIANLDPLGHNIAHHPLLELAEFNIEESDLGRVVIAEGYRGGRPRPVGEIVHQLKQTYCGTFAVEFMDIRDPEQHAWLIEKMEPTLNQPALDDADRKFILERLIAAEEFEQFLQRNFPPSNASATRAATPSSPSSMPWSNAAPASAWMKWSSAWPTAAASTCWPTSSTNPTK